MFHSEQFKDDDDETGGIVSHEEHIGKKSFFSDSKGNLKFVNFVVRFPNTVFFLLIFICIGNTVFLRFTIDESPFTEDTNEYDIFDTRSIAYDSLRLAKKEVKDSWTLFNEGRRMQMLINPSDESSRWLQERTQEDIGDITYWVYSAKTNDGLFTNEGIPFMREAEATILENPDYPKYCVLLYEDELGNPFDTPVCRPPLSAMNIYYASDWNSTVANEIMDDLADESKIATYNQLSICIEYGIFCEFLPTDTTDEDLAWVSSTSIKINSMIMNWDGAGDLNENVEEVTLFIAYMNELLTKAASVAFFVDSNFNVGNPVTQYSRSILYWGELLEGTTKQEESESKLKKFILDNLIGDWNNVQSSKHNPEVQSYYFMGVLIFDLIIQILIADGIKALASFFAVFFYLRYMIGSWFLASVGMFEVFMSLPLAWVSFSFIFQIKYFSALNSLCIFIVMAIGADDIFVFMDAYKQSASKGKDVVQSLETRMSWVYRRSGSAMLLTSVTTCCAFLCTLISPIAGTRSFGIFAALVILFDYVLVMTLYCTSVIIYHDRFESKSFCCNCTFWRKSETTSTDEAMLSIKSGLEPKIDRISSFFQNKVGPFVLNVRNRSIILVCLAALIATAAVYAAKLEPTTSAEQFLDEDHPLQIGVTILTNEFENTEDDETSFIHFVWGLEEISRDGVNQLLDPEFVGDASFSDSFTFNEQCQTALYDACISIRADSTLEPYVKRRAAVGSVDCFVEELGAYNILGGASTCPAVFTGEWSDQDWEINDNSLSSIMANFLDTAACNGDNGKNVRKFYQDSMGWDGVNMRYAGISVESTDLTPRGVLSEEETRTQYDKLVELAVQLDETISGACGTNVIMTDLDQKFVFMNNQRIYRTSAVSGSMIGVSISFVVLLISTRKFHISFFATISIFSVLLGVIGSVTMIGWTLGTIEAILISILAGFSVDYVIHLAHAYVHAEGDPSERVKLAYGDMGVSVFSGMLTSVVASIPLFFCTLTFFAKFGAFLCLTITWSWVMANFGFMSLLAQFKISMDKKWL